MQLIALGIVVEILFVRNERKDCSNIEFLPGRFGGAVNNMLSAFCIDLLYPQKTKKRKAAFMGDAFIKQNARCCEHLVQVSGTAKHQTKKTRLRRVLSLLVYHFRKYFY